MHFAMKSGTSGCFRFIPCSIIVIAFLVLTASADEVSTTKWNQTTLDALRRDLFVNYNKNTHPLHNGLPTNISIGMSVQFADIDEMKGKMTLHAWLKLNWTDDKLKWQPSEYGGLTQIHFRPTEVWRPDITLFNSADEAGNYVGQTQILLIEEGGLLWVPPVIYTSYCNLDLQMWPFDSQTCLLKIGLWSVDYIDLKHFNDAGESEYNEIVQTTEWTVSGGLPTFHQEEYYNYAEFNFVLTRRSSMYTAVIFTPASCVILLVLAGFWLPPQMGEKILLNGIVIVVIAAFLMYFAQLLPVLAESTPLVVLFYSSSLLLTSISTIIAVMVLYLSTAKHCRRVPDFLRDLLNGPVGTVLCLSQFSLEAEPDSLLTNSTKELAENNYETPADVIDAMAVNPAPPTTRSIQFDWILLATAIDRICFLFYCVIFIVLAIVYSV